jgi:hypothetical protein
VSLNGYKDIRLYEDRATSYIVAHGVNIAPLYAITAKINLQGSFVWERREFRGVGDPDFVIGSQREDIFRFGRVTLTYQPLRFVDLSLSFESGDRSSNVVVSNISINSYDYQAWMATAKISW